jgi:ribosomal protein S18 acetylase RimI-like enzyme
MSSIEIKAISPDEIRSALRLTLATPGQSAAELERHVTEFIRYAHRMSLDLTRQWLCLADDRAATGCTCIESPGHTAALLLPDSALAQVQTPLISELLLHVIEQESTREISLMQCLIRPDDQANRAALEQVGFHSLATLLYMEWNVAAQGAPVEPDALPALENDHVEWITYDDLHHDEFARLIEATYQDTLDCPGLKGLRPINDVISGHKAAGLFRPHRWMLWRCNGRSAGCILFAEAPLRPALELVYMGVHPNWRGHHVGQFLLSHGLSMARREHFPTITLAVDAANAPALVLYQSAGFRETTRRRAMIRTLDSSSSGP